MLLPLITKHVSYCATHYVLNSNYSFSNYFGRFAENHKLFIIKLHFTAVRLTRVESQVHANIVVGPCPALMSRLFASLLHLWQTVDVIIMT